MLQQRKPLEDERGKRRFGAFTLLVALGLVASACSSGPKQRVFREETLRIVRTPSSAPSGPAPGTGAAATSAPRKKTGGASGQSSGGTRSAGGAYEGSFRVALSVSPFAEVVINSGHHFSDGQRTALSVSDLQAMLIAHGGNEVFSRISTERKTSAQGEDKSLSGGLKRAQLAASLKVKFNPEFGLFATYGDITCQPAPNFSEYPEISVPGAWGTLNTTQMVKVLRDYGALVAKAVADSGTEVVVWDIGNEVDFGTAGVAPRPLSGVPCDGYRAPNGVDPEIAKESVQSLLAMPEPQRIAWLKAHVWPHEARLLAGFADGVKTVVPKARFSTHVSGVSAVSPTQSTAFWDEMRKGGFSTNEIGFSFYPSSPSQGGALSRFKATVDAMRNVFGLPVFVAEYAYPAARMTGNSIFSDWNREESGYPISEEGQANLLRDLVSWGKGHGFSGIRPWGPEIFVGEWGPMSMFRETGPGGLNGRSRPVLDSILKGIG